MKLPGLLLALLLVISMTTPHSASAQTSTAVSELTGLTIDLGPSGEASFVDPAPAPYEEDGYLMEDFEIQRGTSFFFIGFVDGYVDIDEWFESSLVEMAAIINPVEVLYEDHGLTKTRAIYRGNYELNHTMTYYAELSSNVSDGSTMMVIVQSADSPLADDMAWAQENITLDGEPLVSPPQRVVIQAAVDGTSGVPPRTIEGFTSTLADWTDQGLVSDTQWVSPHTGNAIAWNGTEWQFPYYDRYAVNIDPNGVDRLNVATQDRSGLASIWVYPVDAAPGTDEMLDYLMSDEMMGAYTSSGYETEVVTTSVTDNTASVVLLLHDQYGRSEIAILDSYVTHNFAAITFIFADPADIPNVYESFRSNVTLNGDTYPMTWTVEDIQALPIP